MGDRRRTWVVWKIETVIAEGPPVYNREQYGYHHRAKIDKATGLRLQHGNGCAFYSDCFTCPYPPEDCRHGRVNNENGKSKAK